MTIEVKNKLSEIESIVKDKFPYQSCYFRGEPRFYETISAGLHRHRHINLPFYYRENSSMKSKNPRGINLGHPQQIPVSLDHNPLLMNTKLELDILKPESLYDLAMIAGSFIIKRTGNTSNKESALGILQHLGYPTPYLDFTKNYLVSLYFACEGLPNEDGRVIILGDSSSYKIHDMTQAELPVAKERAIAQESVMLEKLELKKAEDNYVECCIPYYLKSSISEYLERCNINKASLFPDNWEDEKRYKPYKILYQGVQVEKDGNFLDAIDRYTDAINLNPDFADAYKRRGRIFYYKRWSEKARHDLETAVRLDASDKIIEVHPYFEEVNVGRMNFLLGEIYDSRGNERESYKRLRRAKELQDRYNKRQEELKLKNG